MHAHARAPRVMCTHTQRSQKRLSDLLEQKLQEVMGRLTQVLGTELGFSRAASALNH